MSIKAVFGVECFLTVFALVSEGVRKVNTFNMFENVSLLKRLFSTQCTGVFPAIFSLILRNVVVENLVTLTWNQEAAYEYDI